MQRGRCITGHYYDMDLYEVCPHCGSSERKNNTYDIDQYIKNVEENVTQSLFNNVNSKEKNHISSNSREKRLNRYNIEFKGVLERTDYVAGWLVFRSGVMKGSSVEVKARNNTIGSSQLMDIIISGDDDIRYNEHAIIEYDSNSHRFFIKNGNYMARTYVNNKRIFCRREIKTNSVIRFGDTEMIFIAFDM